jgi:regulator of protease activity HflC (stomatin/prohibitin superfamily)
LNKFRLGLFFTAIIIVLALIVTPFFLERIAPGHVGVVYKPGSGVQDKTLEDKWHFVSPFDKITEYPIRLQTVDAKNMTLATADGKNVDLDFSYSYAVAADKVVPIYNKFGPVKVEDIEKTYLKKRLFDAARNVISQYTVLELYGEKSGEAQAAIKEAYTKNVAKIGFVVDEVTLGAPKPDANTQAAIDARVNAAQELDRKKTELEIAKAEAERKRAEAQGIADSELIKAEGTAKANKALQVSITPELIQYEIAKKWNGQQPLVTGSGGQIIQMPLPGQADKK